MKRHNALRTVGLLTIGLALGFISTADAAKPKRVNILFVSVGCRSCETIQESRQALWLGLGCLRGLVGRWR